MEVGKKNVLNGFIGGNNSTQFVIPIYQRSYVWEKKNIFQLMNDIEKMIPFYDAENENIFHFFGSIVYIDTLHKGSFSEWTIIDGQQRLTTIFLILQVLKEIYPESKKVISKKYLLNDEDIINTNDEMDRYRLKPLISDDNVYKMISDGKLDNIEDKEQNSNVFKAFNIIKKELIVWKKTYTVEQILGAIDKFKIVWIQLDKKENPQQVFESINSTGVNLTAADLIRNFILMNKDNKNQTEIYNTYWKPIEFDYVGTKNLKEFFRFYVSIKERLTIPEREVYERFKIQYENLLKDNLEEDILQEILNYAKNYYYICCDATKLPNSNIIEPIMKDYRSANSNMPHIVILETLYLYYNNNLISEEDLINTIKLLTTYIIRRNIAGEDTKSISNMFGSALGRILKYFNETGNYYKSVLKTFIIDTRLTNQFMPTDKILIDEFSKSNLYSRDSISFILKKIENNESRIPYSQLNIEHVMPQSETAYWKKNIKEDSVYEEIVNRIGNLTLVDSKDNSSMQNKDFASKKRILNKSRHIKMNEFILGKNEWNEEEIIKRSISLANEFILLFPYPEIELNEVRDIYLYLNLNEDSINDASDYANSIPLEIAIGEDITTDLANWTEVLKYILSTVYNNVDAALFLRTANDLVNEYGYKTDQISSNIKNMRKPEEFVDGLYVECNTNTIHKLFLIQRLIKNLNFKHTVVITYELRNKDI